MDVKQIIKKIYFVDELFTKEEALNYLIDRHDENNTINNKEKYKEEIYARESMSTTGVGNKIGIPHALGSMVNETSVVVMVNKQGIDFEAIDQQKVNIIFMLAVKEGEGNEHLKIISQLSQVLMNDETVNQLIECIDENEFLNLLNVEKQEENKKEQYDILAVTACPTGVAHTYMAAEALIKSASNKNVNIKVETNGASGVDHRLSEEEIREARCIIVAADKKVEMDRFNGKYVIKVPVAKALMSPDELIDQAMKQEAIVYEGEIKQEEKQLPVFYNHLMNGISQVIPILMIFGIFNQLCQIFISESSNQMLITMYYLSTIAYSFALPILSAYIADSISDRSGFVVGLIVGALGMMCNMKVLEIIALGFISGYLVRGLNYLFKKLPQDIHSIIPNLLLPLSCTLIMGFVMIFLSQYRFSYESLLLYDYPDIIDFIFGALLGLMMSIDMGGPINKTAYTIGIIGIFIGRYDWMAAVMVGGMIPPLVIGVAMLFKKSLFTKEQLKTKLRCFIKGLCFVSEEAIPYMISDKRGFHNPCLIASAISGGLSMYLGCGQMFPHGGIFTLFFINGWFNMLLILITCSIIGGLLVVLMKKNMV